MSSNIYFNRVVDSRGACSYVPQIMLTDIVRSGNAVQWWRSTGQTVSAKLKRGGIVKRWDSLKDHVAKGEAAFMALIEQCLAVGVVRPSSYSDIFAQRFHSPRIVFSVNALLAPGTAGAWQEATKPGYTNVRLFKYDLNSAYFWSLLSHGLPDTSTFSYVRGYTPHREGVFLCYAPKRVGLPYPYNSPRHVYVLATQTEIAAYQLDITRIIYGITWTRTIAADHLRDIIQTCPASKQVSRTYWGRWASYKHIECHTPSKKWTLGNPIRNELWAHCIMSAVRMKVWRAACNAVHVFVDSVITTDNLPTGTLPGEWKLEREYNNGLVVLGPGMYGPPGSTLEKHCGTSLNVGGWTRTTN